MTLPNILDRFGSDFIFNTGYIAYKTTL